MKINKATLQIVVNHLRHSISGDPMRPNLNLVRIKRVGEHYEVQSTDGHKLCINIVPLAWVESDSPIPFLVTDEYLGECELALKKAPKYNDAFMVDISMWGMRDEGGLFPNIEAIIPDRCKYEYTIGLNAEYLLDMLKSMRTNKKHTLIKLSFRDEKSAILVDVGHPDDIGKGVLMPVRCNGQWAKAEEKVPF